MYVSLFLFFTVIAVLKKRLTSRVMYPFYISVVTYFTLFQPLIRFPPQTWTAAIAKALPVWVLTVYVRLSSREKLTHIIPKSYDHQTMITGLLFFSLGDIFFIFDTDLMEDGMLCFTIAQFYFSLVVQQEVTNSRVKYVFLFFGLVSFSFVMNYIDDGIMDVFVLFHLLLIYTVGWRSTCRLRKDGMYFSTLMPCLGSLLFIASDSLQAANKWRWKVAFIDFWGTLFDYTALLCYALMMGTMKTDLHIERKFLNSYLSKKRHSE